MMGSALFARAWKRCGLASVTARAIRGKVGPDGHDSDAAPMPAPTHGAEPKSSVDRHADAVVCVEEPVAVSGRARYRALD